MHIKIQATLGLVIVFLLAGCSGGDPVLPGESGPGNEISAAVSGIDGGRMLWGIYEVVIDPAVPDVRIMPARTGEFHANVRSFLEDLPCHDCLKIVAPIVPQPYGMDVNIALEHPFPGLNEYIGFDVRGIVMMEGTYEFSALNIMTTRAPTGEWALLNPDGFTRVFNAGEYSLPGILGYSPGRMLPPTWPPPPDNLNPFKAYYSNGQGEDEGGRRAFFPGDEVTRTFKLQLVEGMEFKFWYAIDASWEPPPGDPPYSVSDFPPEANCPEAYRFDFSVVSGELNPDGGQVRIGADIWDHQGWSPPWMLSLLAPECSNLIQLITTPPMYIDGDRAHWEFNVTNVGGGLDSMVGTELLLVDSNRDDDPFNGPVKGYGRFTIPVVPQMSDCNAELHENYIGTGEFTGGSLMEALDAIFIHDTGTETDGEFLGYIIGIAGTLVITVIIDTLEPEAGHNLGMDWGNPHIGSTPTPNSIDVAEETGRFFIAWSDSEAIVEVWEVSGKLDGETNASNNGQVFCLDTDGSGGFWNAYFPEFGFAPGIKHFIPDEPDSGRLSEVTADAISLPEAWGTPTEIICIPDDRLLVLTGVEQGKVRAYDISVSPPEFIDEITGIFSGDLDFGEYPDKSCDMVIDWSDPDLAHCRIVAFGNIADAGVELVKLDTDMNILAGPIPFDTPHYHSIDLNPHTGDIALWPNRDGSAGEYVLIEQPPDW